LKLLDIHTFTSPNVYSLDQDIVLIRIRLDNLKETETKDIPGFNENIIHLFPGLANHKCTKGYVGGFLDRLEEGTYLAHVMEHLCLEIQGMLGIDVKYGKARQEFEDIYKIIFACENTSVGKACAYFIYETVYRLANDEQPQFEEGYSRLKQLNTAYHTGASAGAILKEAKRRGIPTSEISDSGLIRLGYGKYQRYISSTLFENTSSIATDIACDKALTKALLDEVCIPVPEGQVCFTIQDAVSCAQNIGYPVVVKPKCGNKGKYVAVNLKDDVEVELAFAEALTLGPEVIIEKYILGKDYRILVVHGKVVAVAERIPAKVVGDGKHTITELIDLENSNPLRGEDHEKPLTKIKIDDYVIRTLFKQGIELETIPRPAQIIYLRTNSNLSTGGTAIDCTDLIHPHNKEIAEIAVKTINLDIAGIDLVIPDISQPLSRDFGAVVEVNAAPGIRMHLNPTEGQKRDVVSPILDMIYPPNQKSSIPIISITGTNGKTTTTRMVNHILKHSGYFVGMTTTHGIYINGQCIEDGDTTGYMSACRVLNNRQIDVAVLETARGGIIKNGLGYRKADVAVLTNISNDHLGVDGLNTMEELYHIKSLVTEAVKEDGFCVLNADDNWALKARNKAGGRIVLFTFNKDNPEFVSHIQTGGYGVFVDNNSIYVSKKGRIDYVIDIESIPATLGGILKHNIFNAMAAIAACHAVGIPLININKAIRLFSCELGMNPGRFNVFDLKGDIKVILDYGHNYDGYRVTIDGLKGLNPERLVGVIGVPGDRRNEDIINIGNLAGKYFDELIIKEDKNLRERQPLAVASLLKTGALAAGLDHKAIKIIPLEEAALKYALANAVKGDVIVVFFEKMDPLLKVIQQFNSSKTYDLISYTPFAESMNKEVRYPKALYPEQ